MHQCLSKDCKYKFQTTTGTSFSDTHLPLSKWMMAIAILFNAKKGAPAKQIERDLGVSYKMAWDLSHRIRKGMKADETYAGGKFHKRRARAEYDKIAVSGMKERETGRVHIKHVSNANRWNIGKDIGAVVAKQAVRQPR